MPEKSDAELVADLAHLDEMLAKLLLRLVQGGERRAGELQLAARLEADNAALRAVEAAERDDLAALEHGVPAEAILQAFEQRLDAALAVVRDRRVAAPVEAELLVLGADAPFAARLRARFEIGDELVPRLDGRALRPSYACRHGKTSSIVATWV